MIAGTISAEVVLDPAGTPALLSEPLDVLRGEAVLGTDLLEHLRSGFALLGSGCRCRHRVPDGHVVAYMSLKSLFIVPTI
jgi:hypothetical protein